MCLESVDALKWVLFLFVCVERVTERTHAHMVLEGLSTFPIRSSVSLISLALRVFSSLVDPRGSKKPVVYVHFISQLQSSEGGPGLLSQQITTHHFLLSSLLLGPITESRHSGSMILLVSQGRLFIQFSPQHCTVARSFSSEWEKKKREIGDSAEAQLVLISVLRGISWKQGDPAATIFTDDLCRMYGMFSPESVFYRVSYLLIS